MCRMLWLNCLRFSLYCLLFIFLFLFFVATYMANKVVYITVKIDTVSGGCVRPTVARTLD